MTMLICVMMNVIVSTKKSPFHLEEPIYVLISPLFYFAPLPDSLELPTAYASDDSQLYSLLTHKNNRFNLGRGKLHFLKSSSFFLQVRTEAYERFIVIIDESD